MKKLLSILLCLALLFSVATLFAGCNEEKSKKKNYSSNRDDDDDDDDDDDGDDGDSDPTGNEGTVVTDPDGNPVTDADGNVVTIPNVTEPSTPQGPNVTEPMATEPAPTEPTPTEPTGTSYTIYVVDEAGNPVPGVRVQICDSNNGCRVPKLTNAQGIVVYENQTEGEYKAQLTKLPEGYDPVESMDTYYPFGDSTEVTICVKNTMNPILNLRDLCTNLESYMNQKVAFEGVIVSNNNQTVYVQDYDPETEMYYGINVYYGYGLSGEGLEILSPGNRVRIVGTLMYSDGWGWQVSDIYYNPYIPDHPDNIQLIEKNTDAQ